MYMRQRLCESTLQTSPFAFSPVHFVALWCVHFPDGEEGKRGADSGTSRPMGAGRHGHSVALCSLIESV